MPLTTTFRQGDVVAVTDPSWPGLWRVEKVNPRKYQLRPCDEDGNLKPGRGLNADHSLCVQPSEAAAALAARTAYYEPLWEGTLVEWNSAKSEPGKVWVVTKDDPHNARTNIAPLGGGGGGWRVARRTLTPVPVAEHDDLTSWLEIRRLADAFDTMPDDEFLGRLYGVLNGGE